MSGFGFFHGAGLCDTEALRVADVVEVMFDEVIEVLRDDDPKKIAAVSARQSGRPRSGI